MDQHADILFFLIDHFIVHSLCIFSPRYSMIYHPSSFKETIKHGVPSMELIVIILFLIICMFFFYQYKRYGFCKSSLLRKIYFLSTKSFNICILSSFTGNKNKKTKKKQKTKIASITLKPITVLDTTPYHNFGLVYFC